MSVSDRSDSIRALPGDAIRQAMWRTASTKDAERPGTVCPSAGVTADALLSAVDVFLRRPKAGPASSSAPAEDVADCVVDIWAAGEASASLAFGTARVLEELASLQKRGAANAPPEAMEYLELAALPPFRRNQARLDELRANPLVAVTLVESAANVLRPALQLWNIGPASRMVHDARSLPGASPASESVPDVSPGGPVDARLLHSDLSAALTSEVFLAQLRHWIHEMRGIASTRPGTGACTLASAMHLWHWTQARMVDAGRRRALSALGDALCWLLAARCQILDVVELETRAAERPDLHEAARSYTRLLSNLCHVQAARAAGETGRICAELVHGYNRHPSWDDACAGACCTGDEVDEYDALFPGFAATSRALLDVVEADGSHATKAGPCARFPGLQRFQHLRSKLDGCLTGSRLARDAAAEALAR